MFALLASSRFLMFIQSGEIAELLLGIVWLEVVLMFLSFYDEKRLNQIFAVLGMTVTLIFDLILINYLYFHHEMFQAYLFFAIMATILTILWPGLIIGRIAGHKIVWKL
jgi:hypothetical protein